MIRFGEASAFWATPAVEAEIWGRAFAVCLARGQSIPFAGEQADLSVLELRKRYAAPVALLTGDTEPPPSGRSRIVCVECDAEIDGEKLKLYCAECAPVAIEREPRPCVRPPLLDRPEPPTSSAGGGES